MANTRKRLPDHTIRVVSRITIALVALLSVMFVWIGARMISTGSPVKYVEKNTGKSNNQMLVLFILSYTNPAIL